MSQARVYTTKIVRKDWTCGKCGAAIRKGVDGRISFSVGFRGREQTRCMKKECYPSRSELESSAVASVYDAIDSVDLSALDSVEDIQDALNEVASACREVADEYESNEMYEINEQLQERAEMLNSAADELESWSWDGEPDPQEEQAGEEECSVCQGTGEIDNPDDDSAEDYPTIDCEECNGTGVVENDEEADRDEWIASVQESAQEVLDSIELP